MRLLVTIPRCDQSASSGSYLTCKGHVVTKSTIYLPTKLSSLPQDRYAVSEMQCMMCGTQQPVAQNCTTCGEQLARYYCNICHLFDDEPGRDIYHCPFCNVCRRGKVRARGGSLGGPRNGATLVWLFSGRHCC